MVTSLLKFFLHLSRYSPATHNVLYMMMVVAADIDSCFTHLRLLRNQIVMVSQNLLRINAIILTEYVSIVVIEIQKPGTLCENASIRLFGSLNFDTGSPEKQITMKTFPKSTPPYHSAVIAAMLTVALFSCGGSKETRLQRFLLQSNTLMKDHQEGQAEYYLKEALKLDSCFADAWNNLGTMYFNQQRYTLALDQYDRAIACKPDYLDAYFNRANTAYELKEYYASLKDIERIIRMKPDTAVVYSMQGLNFTRLRQFEDALTAFDRAAALASSDAEALVNIGTVHYYRKDFDSARFYLEEALKIDPQEANVFNALAMIEVEKNNYNKANEWIAKALALKPGDPFFINNRGYIELLTGQPDKAKTDIDQSIMQDPTNGWAYRNKGIYYINTGKYQDAVRLLQQAIDMDPFIEKVHFYLGHAYAKLSDSGNACLHYRKSRELKEITDAELKQFCR